MAKVKCPLMRVRMCRWYNYLMPSVVYFATGASTVRVRARSPHASELLPGKSKSRSNKSCEVRAEGEQKPSGAVERASHDDARPTEPTAYTLKGINALTHFNSRAGEEKGGLEGKTPVLPSGVQRYCIPPAACSLYGAAQMGFFERF